MKQVQRTSRTELGEQGVRLVASELSNRGYKSTIMPKNNIGFDIRITTPGESPPDASFDDISANVEIEVKRSTSVGTQVPIQIRTHLECPLRRRLYVILKDHETEDPDYFIMSHEEIQKAWSLMPRIKPNGEPYVIRGSGYIDWKYIQPHLNRWDKLQA